MKIKCENEMSRRVTWQTRCNISGGNTVYQLFFLNLKIIFFYEIIDTTENELQSIILFAIKFLYTLLRHMKHKEEKKEEFHSYLIRKSYYNYENLENLILRVTIF